MAKTALVDTGYLIALLSRRDIHHAWAARQASELPPPWLTCEAVLSEAFHLLGGHKSLAALITRGALVCRYRFANDMDGVLKLIERYANVPMRFADACLVRMTETLADPVLLTTDSDFLVYRRHGRHVVPCLLPG